MNTLILISGKIISMQSCMTIFFHHLLNFAKMLDHNVHMSLRVISLKMLLMEEIWMLLLYWNDYTNIKDQNKLKKLPCLEIEDTGIFIHLCTDFFFFYIVHENLITLTNKYCFVIRLRIWIFTPWLPRDPSCGFGVGMQMDLRGEER